MATSMQFIVKSEQAIYNMLLLFQYLLTSNGMHYNQISHLKVQNSFFWQDLILIFPIQPKPLLALIPEQITGRVLVF